MELVGEAVEHRHPGVLGKLLHDFLAEAAVLNAVEHPPQHPGGVGDGLLLADLGAGGIQVGDAHAEIMPGHLEGAAGTGGGLLKDQGDVFALQHFMGNAGLFLGLELGGYIQEVGNFRRGEVQQFQKMLLHFKRPLFLSKRCL